MGLPAQVVADKPAAGWHHQSAQRARSYQSMRFAKRTLPGLGLRSDRKPSASLVRSGAVAAPRKSTPLRQNKATVGGTSRTPVGARPPKIILLAHAPHVGRR